MSGTSDDSRDADAAVVGRWLELLASGRAPSLDEFCTRLPETDRERIRSACLRAGTALHTLSPGLPVRDLRGQKLGEFELVDEIGRGGMGVVYRARQPSLRRDVAVKVLNLSHDVMVGRLGRFRTEAQATARIDDPRIVKVFSVGEDDGISYIAMELVDGHSLHEDFARQIGTSDSGPSALPRPVDEDSCRTIAEFFAKLAEGLHSAHSAKVLHRDVQPKNLLIDRRGEPRIIDFGLARILDEPGVTKTGEIAGTPFYMSPEQVQARRDTVDHRTDVYSLGAVLYEALTARRPFEGDTSQQVMERIVRDEPRRADRINPAVPRALATVCGRALEKSRELRFADAGAFATELRRVVAGLPIHSREPSAIRLTTRWISRHPLAFWLPVVSVTAIALAFLMTRPALPTVEVEIASGVADGAEIRAEELDPIRWEPIGLTTLGRAPLRSLLPRGYYRIWAVYGDSFAELRFAAPEPGQRLAPPAIHLASVAAVRSGMVEIPAGRFRFGTDRPTNFAARGPQDIDQPGFLIDECEVSNADYKRFVEATGASPSAYWPKDWSRNWDPRWDDLPVPGVTGWMAQAYANWVGKRLPTEKEWERAGRGNDGRLLPWRADLDHDDAVARAVIARGVRPAVIDPATRWAAYLEHAQPVRSAPEAATPEGIFQMCGNLTEWTESTVTRNDETGIRVISDALVMKGASWDDVDDERVRLDHIKVMFAGDYNDFIGFRCAKSLEPPTPSR